MKVLGVDQFVKKKFKLLEIRDEKWKAILGDIPAHFIAIIYGKSGNGKTEFCIQFAKLLMQFGRVGWLSYEQGHGYDLQKAVIRNNMSEFSGRFLPVDPKKNVPKGMSLFENLDRYLSKRGSPEFVFIDSLDYTRLTNEQYFALKEKYENKKGIIFISHAAGKLPKKPIGVDIEYDGGMGFYVEKFIAKVHKNRFGGYADYIIYEERARELNPLYFEQKAIKGNTNEGKKAH